MARRAAARTVTHYERLGIARQASGRDVKLSFYQVRSEKDQRQWWARLPRGEAELVSRETNGSLELALRATRIRACIERDEQDSGELACRNVMLRLKASTSIIRQKEKQGTKGGGEKEQGRQSAAT